MITDLDYAPEFGLSGIEDVRAYKRQVKPIHHTLFSFNRISKEMEKLAMQRFYKDYSL